MKSSSSQTLQIKLSLDDGLKGIWELLREEYKGLDKSGIVRLALNTLAKPIKQEKFNTAEFDLDKFFNDLDKGKSGMTEKEFAVWWNNNKKDLRV